jgi:hypothetical protein
MIERHGPDQFREFPSRESALCVHQYNVGHQDWARGRPAPFLPGPAKRHLLFEAGRDPGATLTSLHVRNG